MSIYKSYRKTCPDFIVNEFVTQVIKTTSVRDGYATIKVTPKGDNSPDKTSVYCQLTSITVVCRKGCLVDIVDVLVKSGPKNKKLREIIPVGELFKRETFFYEVIVPEIRVLDFTPTLIASSVDENEEAMILQNAAGMKYEKWVGELTHEHVRVILGEFARFHGLVFVFSRNKTEKFHDFKNSLKNGFLSSLQNARTIEIIREILKKVAADFTDDKVKKKLEEFEGEVGTYLQNVLNDSSTIDVIVHGFPTNNFLFKYEKSEDGSSRLSRAKLTEWQLVKFGSPVLDLSLFFFTNCFFDDFTNNNITQLLQSYHSNLKALLKELNYDVDDFFSFDKLQEHWRKYAKYGFAVAFLALKVMTVEVGKRPNPNEENLTVEEFIEGFVGPPNDEFRRRIKDLVSYGVDSGLI